MKIAQKPKYELIHKKKEWGGPRLTKLNPTAKKETANPIDAAPATLKNHPSEAPRRRICGVASANAPTLPAITTNSRETGRKLSGPLTSGETL